MVIEGLRGFLGGLLDPTGFMPRRSCGRWSPGLILLHNSSDALTAGSYFAITFLLIYFVLRRLDAPFRPVFWLFGAFIFACGLTHLLEMVVFYSPVYRLIGLVKLGTGIISAVSTVALVRVMPAALSLRGTRSLELELEERLRAEEAAKMRTRQLEALVELSRRALAAGDPALLSGEVACLVAGGLGVDLCGVFQATGDRAGLRLLAGVGWGEGLVGSAVAPAGGDSLAGFVARGGGVVVSADLDRDDRFAASALEREHGAAAGLGVVVQGTDGPHGVLAVYRRRGGAPAAAGPGAARPFGEDDVSFLRSVAGLLGSNLSRIEAERALTSQATTDALTGLHNARHLREALPTIGSRASRAGEPLSAIMLDIDHFKAFNDSFGHSGGDDVLREVGAILRREARAHDLVARYGGEEFALVLPGADAAEARAFAGRVRRAIGSHPWPLRPVTASLGIATGGPGGPAGGDLLDEADQALYVAKRSGRDRVVHRDDLRGGPDLGPPPAGRAARPAEVAPSGATLLHIDDDDAYRRAIGRHLSSAEIRVVAAGSAAEGLRRAPDGPDLILLDVRLPDGDGLEICRRLKADPATAMTPVVLLSSTLLHGEARARALGAGASAALPKSTEPEELLAVISALLRAGRSEKELVRARLGMGERLRDQAAELERVCDATIEGWARALELRDHETEGHSRRVTELTLRVARRMGLGPSELLHVRRGALLHDIGKVGVPDAILNKPGPLDEAEWRAMRRHPELAYHLLRPIEFLRNSLDIPYSHHERWDGQGYPNGLRGEEIPLAARIFMAADIYDALSHDRPYRPAWPEGQVRDYLRSLSGSHIDPEVVRAILELV